MGILDKMKGKKAESKKDDKPKKAPAKKTEEAAAPAAEEKKAEKKAPAKGPLAREGAGDAHRILIRPVFTEKASRLQAQNQYVFTVAPKAGKVEIAQAIRDLYGVKPETVRIVRLPGKAVRFGKYAGKEKDIKKAIVTLKAGDTLTVLEG